MPGQRAAPLRSVGCQADVLLRFQRTHRQSPPLLLWRTGRSHRRRVLGATPPATRYGTTGAGTPTTSVVRHEPTSTACSSVAPHMPGVAWTCVVAMP